MRTKANQTMERAQLKAQRAVREIQEAEKTIGPLEGPAALLLPLSSTEDDDDDAPMETDPMADTTAASPKKTIKQTKVGGGGELGFAKKSGKKSTNGGKEPKQKNDKSAKGDEVEDEDEDDEGNKVSLIECLERTQAALAIASSGLEVRIRTLTMRPAVTPIH